LYRFQRASRFGLFDWTRIRVSSSVNTAISGVETGAFETFDIASKVSIGRCWQGPSITPDGIHPNQTGYLLEKNSGGVIEVP
jgi:hypothetical protein